MEEKLTTLHPQGKQGVNISKAKYEQVKQAILESIPSDTGLTFNELTEAVGAKLGDNFDGSIGWYTTTVKLDLEARGMIERVPNESPQRLKLVK